MAAVPLASAMFFLWSAAATSCLALPAPHLVAAARRKTAGAVVRQPDAGRGRWCSQQAYMVGKPTCLWDLSDDIMGLIAAAVEASREQERESWLASWVSAEMSRMDDSVG